LHSGSIIAKYKDSAEFKKLSVQTQKDYLVYVSKIQSECGAMPIAALGDQRVRGDFLEWRDGMAASPRTADYAWTILARILIWAKDRSLIPFNPWEKGRPALLGRGPRRDRVDAGGAQEAALRRF